MVAICIAVFALLAGAWRYMRRKRRTALGSRGQETEKEAENKITETEKDGRNMAVEKNTTYRVAWTDYEGRACRVDIVDLETVSPVVKTLEPGQNPFVSKMADDDDPLKPLRSGSGTISVVANFEVMKLFDMTSGHRYRVVVYRSEAVVWQGWLKGESLSQDYESAKSEFSLGCVDDIEALGCWDMTQKDETINGFPFVGDMGLQFIWRILAECFAHVSGTGGTPPLTFEFPTDGSVELWQLRALVSRGLFFESVTFDNDEDEEEKKRLYDSMTCKEALEIVCTSFGWSCQAMGSRIIFSTPRVSGDYYVTSMESLYKGGLEGYRYAIGEVAPTSMGDHEVSQYPGAHKINVRAELKKNTDLLPSLEDAMEFVKDEGTVTRELTVRAITYKSNSGKVVLQGYKMTTTKEAPKLATDYDIAKAEYGASDYFTVREPDVVNNYQKVGCMIVGLTKEDSYTPDDTKKNYEFKTGLGFNIFYPIYRTASGDTPMTPSKAVRGGLPMVTLRGEQVALSGGALVLNANIGSMAHKKTADNWLINSLLVSVRIGEYYYDRGNKTWTTDKVVFDALLEDSLGASIDDDKTLEMPYTGASGLIMPIDRMLSGEVELCIYPPVLYRDSVRLTWRRFIVYGLSLKHQDEDTTLAKDLPDHYNYTKYLEHWQDDTKTVNVKMHSRRDGQNGLGQLYVLDSAEEELIAVEKIDGKRPEQALLNRYVDIFGRVRQMVTVTAKQDDEMRPNRVWTDANGKKWTPLAATKVNWRTGAGEYLFVD